MSFGQGTAKTIKVGRVVAVLAIATLILSVLLSHICMCFGLYNTLRGHIYGIVINWQNYKRLLDSLQYS